MSKEAAMMYAVAALGVSGLRSATQLERVTPPLANLVISNVPGIREKAYLNGAPLVGVYPVSAIAASIGLNATLSSYHDHMDFGFVANGVVMYDLPELTRHVQEAFEELKAASSPRRAEGSRKSKSKSKSTGKRIGRTKT